MSLTHVHIRHLTVGAARGTGAQVVHYLERTHQYAPEVKATVEYLDRRGAHVVDREDLVDKGVANLPSWAEGKAERFFEAAYAYERANGRWATTWQCSLPRELSQGQQIALAQDFIATHLPHRPTLWVLHDPVNDQGAHQPHIHILFSERQMDGIERDAVQTFKRYNATHPERGGAQKETFGRGDRQAPYRLREAWCASVNVHLEQSGISDAWLDPRSLKVRGIDRQPVRYVYAESDTHKLEARLIDERTPETRAKEATVATQWWTDYKRSMGLTPTHMQDPHAVLQMIAREVRDPGTRARELAQQQTGHTPVREPGLDGPLIGNVRSKIYHRPGDPNYGDVQPRNQVLFYSRQAAEDAGYRAAVNQHYGPGAHVRAHELAEEIHRLHAELRILQRAQTQVGRRRMPEETGRGRGYTVRFHNEEQDYERSAGHGW
jgi:MobA/MobL family